MLKIKEFLNIVIVIGEQELSGLQSMLLLGSYGLILKVGQGKREVHTPLKTMYVP